MKLFIPGPVQVSDDVLEQMSRPMIYHRSKEIKTLTSEIKHKISNLLNTSNEVLLLTGSATAAMETAIRSLVNNKVLCIANGEFGRRWFEIASANGKDAFFMDFGDGKKIDFDKVAHELKRHHFEAITFIINETSIGIENNLKMLRSVVNEISPDTLILADAVTAAFGSEFIVNDADFLLFGTQKSLALPPGLAIIIANKRCFDKAIYVNSKGYYLNLTHMKKFNEENLTVTTPNISLMFALDYKLKKIQEITISEYLRQHNKRAELIRSWAQSKGFELFVKDGYSKTATVIVNSLGIDVEKFIGELQHRGYLIANGYGPLKGLTFRIGHMGDISLDDTKALIAEMNKLLEPQMIKDLN